MPRLQLALSLALCACLLSAAQAGRTLQAADELDAQELAAPAPAPAGAAPAPAPAAAELVLPAAKMTTYVLQNPDSEPSPGRTVEWNGQELRLQDGRLATIGEVPEVEGAARWHNAPAGSGRQAASPTSNAQLGQPPSAAKRSHRQMEPAFQNAALGLALQSSLAVVPLLTRRVHTNGGGCERQGHLQLE